MQTILPSVQLYTVRDATAKDFATTLARIAKMGYQGVELAGWGNLTRAADVKKVLVDNGLKASGAHVGIEQLERQQAQTFADYKTIGCDNLIVPWMPQERRPDAAGWKNVAKTMNQLGKKCKDNGFILSYHNHDFEFQNFDGQTGLDILWAGSDPELVKAELDLFWVKKGGQDPVAYLKKLGKRVQLVHLKDMAAGPEGKFANVGTGIMDIPALVQAAVDQGVKWGIVEQDDCYGQDPLEAVRISMENLKKMKLV